MTYFNDGLFEPLRDALQRLWSDTATVKTNESYKDEHNITQSRTVVLFSDEPCKVILTRQDDSGSGVHGVDTYDVKILIRTGLDIPAGATVEVTYQNGIKTVYRRASKGYSGYRSHQVFKLKRDEVA